MRRFWKTLTWSLLAFTVTTVVGYMMTGDWIKGGTIGLLCRGIKIPAYWYHDAIYAKHWPADVVADDSEAWTTTQHTPHDTNVERRLCEIAHQPHVEHCNAG